MGRRHLRDHNLYRKYFILLTHKLSSIKLPAFLLSITLTAAFTLPYLGEKLVETLGAWSTIHPSHMCTFINFANLTERQKVEALVAKNSQVFSLLGGAERLGTQLLEEVPGIASLECSLDSNRTLRLVITGNDIVSAPAPTQTAEKEPTLMQVHPSEATHHTTNTQKNMAPLEESRVLGETFELTLNSGSSFFTRQHGLPDTLKRKSAPPTTKKLRSTTIATNDTTLQETLLFDTKPHLPIKGNEL